MRKCRSTIVMLLLSLLGTGIVASSASAMPIWVLNTHVLKSGETRSVNFKLGVSKVKWEDGSTSTKFEVQCKKATGEAELKGGFPGTDKLTSLGFEECSLLKAGTGCKLSAGGVAAEELPGWPSELKFKGTLTKILADAFTGVRFSLAFTGCEKGAFNKTWIFKNALNAETKNEAGVVKLTLPTLAGGAEGLETEGNEASLSASGELEDKAGASLAAEEATPRWYNAANERFAEGLRTTTLTENIGNMTITSKVEGVEVEVLCTILEGEGWIENPTGGKAGKDLALMIYKKCTVPKPGAGCKVAKGSIRGGAAGDSELVYKSTTIFDEINHGGEIVEPFLKVTIEGCENAALNKSWNVTGHAVGEWLNEKSTLKFNGATGSALKIGSQGATFTAEDKIEVEGGGKILVG